MPMARYLKSSGLVMTGGAVSGATGASACIVVVVAAMVEVVAVLSAEAVLAPDPDYVEVAEADAP